MPYLYPSGLYHHPPLSLLHNPAAAAMNQGLNPGLLFNAQLALAAQHPALFGHYANHANSPLHGLKGHRFSPYSLSGIGSAFDAVTPGHGAPRSLSSSPRPRASSNSPPTRPISVSPAPPLTQAQPPPPTPLKTSSSPSELKSIEKMVNGLEMQKNGVEEFNTKNLKFENVDQ